MKNLKKILIFFILTFISVSFGFSQAQSVIQLSELTVLGSKAAAEIQFTVEDEADSKLITILPFSYKDKSIDEFSFKLYKIQEGLFYAQNMSVTSLDGKTITIIEAELKYSNNQGSVSISNPCLRIKYKPGKMPFPITLKKK